ncbi:carbohydrate-binding module family 20 domain-containing protein [Paenibacillus ihuae]|uniref:carbohydrate-binding module family 20 domain-containing protein n=1 Tax=Paenibacillus ihuae TaxID=1232431 RepID=UPI0006D56086|nr:carbohydrate-binding module family 20 domain-containing protein [Paenibacillus ihuae]
MQRRFKVKIFHLVGNTSEPGSWDTAKAVGPATNPKYPDWNLVVNLPAGTAIQFKAIKKDANNNVAWESGSNRFYTVSSASPAVEFNFNN